MSKLENRDYVIAVDRSGSMGVTDTKSKNSRWKEAHETTVALARKAEQFDPDGINVYVFWDKHKVYNNVSSSAVENIFKEQDPNGGTTLAPVLEAVFADYLSRKKNGQTKANGELLTVITDGQPSDDVAVAKSIAAFTKKLDNGDDEYGILFLQVGQDGSATQFLQMLDDDLVKKYGAAHDIVDTKTVEQIGDMTLVEALEGALND